jgi:hypothetical protein
VQDHPVDPAKDSRSGGNTERQSKHCDRSQGRGPPEDTCCVPEVFKDASHDSTWNAIRVPPADLDFVQR